jgi:hypothetical protein
LIKQYTKLFLMDDVEFNQWRALDFIVDKGLEYKLGLVDCFSRPYWRDVRITKFWCEDTENWLEYAKKPWTRIYWKD